MSGYYLLRLAPYLRVILDRCEKKELDVSKCRSLSLIVGTRCQLVNICCFFVLDRHGDIQLWID